MATKLNQAAKRLSDAIASGDVSAITSAEHEILRLKRKRDRSFETREVRKWKKELPPAKSKIDSLKSRIDTYGGIDALSREAHKQSDYANRTGKSSDHNAAAFTHKDAAAAQRMNRNEGKAEQHDRAQASEEAAAAMKPRLFTVDGDFVRAATKADIAKTKRSTLHFGAHTNIIMNGDTACYVKYPTSMRSEYEERVKASRQSPSDYWK